MNSRVAEIIQQGGQQQAQEQMSEANIWASAISRLAQLPGQVAGMQATKPQQPAMVNSGTIAPQNLGLVGSGQPNQVPYNNVMSGANMADAGMGER